MELSNGIAGTSTRSTRKKHKGSENEEQEDRISKLPDTVLIRILSFLPTEDAVRTLVIPRFGNLWTRIHNIDLDSCLHCPRKPRDYSDDLQVDERFVSLVRHVLIRHQCSAIFKFCLRFRFCLDPGWEESGPFDPEQEKIMRRERRFAEEVNAWIGYALRKEVKILILNFLGCDMRTSEYNFKLPNFVITCDSLTKLKLVSCSLDPSAKIHMRSLKSLRLTEIILSEDTIAKFFSGCPLLEKLSLYNCYGPSVLSITSQSLKRLVFHYGITDLSLEIFCPYITSLNISGWIEGVALKNLSCLVNSTLDFTEDFNGTRGEYLGVRMILQKLHHLDVLTICDRLILVFSIWELTRMAFPSTNWKYLVLKTMLTKWHLPGIASLLRNSPSLETLTIYVYRGESPFSFVDDDMWLTSCDIDGENFWNSQEQSFHCLMDHLKTVRIHGYVTSSCVIQLVQFLLKNAMVLEKMVISTTQNVDPESLEKSSKFPRASTCAVVLFS